MADEAIDGGLVSKVAEPTSESATEKDEPSEHLKSTSKVPTSDYYSDTPEPRSNDENVGVNEAKTNGDDDDDKEADEGTPVDVPVVKTEEHIAENESIRPNPISEESAEVPMETGAVHAPGNATENQAITVNSISKNVASSEGNADSTIKEQKKKKRRKKRRRPIQTKLLEDENEQNQRLDVEIEYVTEPILLPNDPAYSQFHKVFEAFQVSEESADVEETPTAIAARVAKDKVSQVKADKDSDDDDDDEEVDPNKEQPLSKRKLRKMNRMTVAALKQLVEKPEVVEMHDVTALDPRLVVHLKSARNTVSIPRHWCLKRKYLQGKRGIEKPPFDLPYFIKDTGVMEMRQALQEKEDEKTLKAKTRERVRPKMGKLTIDYQKLHDAFFKWQTKPRMLIHGDLYYEGKEFETKLKNKKPGDLSEEMRVALGMPIGPNRHMFPPPWLIAMQRYGPPPSYPSMKIPGLNAPIPEGCSFGYFVGGWGKPPVDEMGRPLYGDVFGMWQESQGQGLQADNVDRTLWGDLESDEEEEEMEEDEDEDEEEEAGEQVVDEAGLVTPAEGLVTPSGLTSIPAGMETPDMIQLRKKKIEEAMESGGETPALFTVLPEKATSVGAAMIGSSHIYDLSAAVPGQIKKASAATGGDGVEVALDPQEIEEMGMDAATTARYEQEMKDKQAQSEKEDLSDMVAEHAARQKNKRKKTQVDSGKAAKKLKEFKF